MKADTKECSTCPPSQEQYEEFRWVNYNYRARDGVLFSTVTPTLEEARRRRDKWLINRALKKRKEEPCG